MTSKDRIFLIDGDNLCHRVYHKFQGLTSKDGKDSTLIYGVPYLILSYIKKYSPDRIYVAFDGGTSPIRRKILPEYKVREPNLSLDYESFQEQKSLLRSYLPAFNIGVIYKRHYEADDLICYLIKKLGKNYYTIVSSDKDFTQLISPYVKILNPFKDAIISSLNCEDIMGYSPEEAVDWLVLDGDKSDKIPGVRGMGPKRIRQFLDEFGSIEDYLEDPKGKWKLEEITQAFETNYPLINLTYFYHRYTKRDEIYVENPLFNKEEVLELCRLYDVKFFRDASVLAHFIGLK